MNEISQYLTDNGIPEMNFGLDLNCESDDRDFLARQLDHSEENQKFDGNLPYMSYIQDYNDQDLTGWVGTPEYHGQRVFIVLFNKSFSFYNEEHIEISVNNVHEDLKENLICLSIALGDGIHILEGHLIDCYDKLKIVLTDIVVQDSRMLYDTTVLARHMNLQYVFDNPHMTVASSIQGTENIWLAPYWVYDIEHEFLRSVRYPDTKGLLFKNNNQTLGFETVIRFYSK
jgi:hypothetical protein